MDNFRFLVTTDEGNIVAMFTHLFWAEKFIEGLELDLDLMDTEPVIVYTITEL